MVIETLSEESRCADDGCPKPVQVLTFCMRHYNRHRQRGDLPGYGACSVDECPRQRYAKGLCRTHGDRVRLYGSTDERPRVQSLPNVLRTRFAGRRATEAELAVELAGRYEIDGECWLWKGAKSADGYALGTGNVRMARLLLGLLEGAPVPRGIVTRHSCHRSMCVRPAHLAPGTDADNAADTVRSGRRPSGNRHYTAKLTEQEVREIRALAQVRGLTQREIARRYGVTQRAVSAIALGHSWKHVQ